MLKQKFDTNPRFTSRSNGLWQIEVFPHPAQITLFGLAKIIKYKKGRVEQRRGGLRELASTMMRRLTDLEPKLVVESRWKRLFAINDELRGKALKAREDQLDAILCAYIAAYHWWWGEKKSEIIPDASEGYIVVPRPRDQSAHKGD